MSSTNKAAVDAALDQVGAFLEKQGFRAVRTDYPAQQYNLFRALKDGFACGDYAAYSYAKHTADKKDVYLIGFAMPDGFSVEKTRVVGMKVSTGQVESEIFPTSEPLNTTLKLFLERPNATPLQPLLAEAALAPNPEPMAPKVVTPIVATTAAPETTASAPERPENVSLVRRALRRVFGSSSKPTGPST